MLQAIEGALRQAFSPSYLKVHDQSSQHAGHGGARPGQVTHIAISISAPCLQGFSRLQQHRQIYACLHQAGFDLHAISIKVIAP